MKIKEIIQVIEQLAPLQLQEGFDNSGVQVGNVYQEAKGTLLSIDVTEAVIDEAIALNCNLIISHHPLAFRAFKSLTGRNYIERCVMKACKHDIVVYAAHTNLDNVAGGINYYLADMLGLQHVRILDRQKDKLLKFVTFVPLEQVDMVRNALFNAGAGTIGEYDSCSYNLQGQGTFRAGAKANPFCGEIGELHTEPEVRIEMVLPVYKRAEIERTLIAVHPYEEPVYDFYALQNTWAQAGGGIVGTLPDEMDEEDFLYQLKDTFHLSLVQHSSLRGKSVRDVAICSGSGAFLIPKAIDYGADVFITGEAKYNDYYDVEDRILLVTVGHYESEIYTKNIFYNLISEKYPTFALYMSGCDINPVKYL